MNFYIHKDWVTVSKNKKIVYYPGFNYIALNNKPTIYDSYYNENEIRDHLFNIKILLLYFHLVNLPFCHFRTPPDENHADLYRSLFKNHDFRELINNFLLFTN